MIRFNVRLVTFVIGVCVGFLITKACNHYRMKSQEIVNHSRTYSEWFANQRLSRTKLQWDSLRYNKTVKSVIESDFLKSRIRILCIILVVKEKNVNASKATWAKGCNHIELIQVKKKDKKPFPVKGTKENSSWTLLCQKLLASSEPHDWVLVVNDSTFVIMENLRYFLAPLDAQRNYYLGYAVVFWSTIYNSGTAGYVMSKGALSAFRQKFSTEDCFANSFWNREDFYLGKHLAKVNVTPVDTRDLKGLSRFHPYTWYQVFSPGEGYYKGSVFPAKCCSDTSISFQAVQGDKMYTFHYLLYELQIFNSGYLGNRPSTTADDSVWKTFLREQNIPNDNLTSKEYYNVWQRLIDSPTSFAAKLKREEYSEYD